MARPLRSFLQEMVDREEELAHQVFDLEGQIGGAADMLVQGGVFAGSQYFLGGGEQPAEHAGARPTQLAQQAVDVALGYPKAESIGGGVLQVMGLVDDQVFIFGQDAVAGGHV